MIALIINGTKSYVKEFLDREHARVYCQNYMDHSKEVLWREITEITITTLKFEQNG